MALIVYRFLLRTTAVRTTTKSPAHNAYNEQFVPFAQMPHENRRCGNSYTFQAPTPSECVDAAAVAVTVSSRRCECFEQKIGILFMAIPAGM
jgi:hypothetical protein